MLPSRDSSVTKSLQSFQPSLHAHCDLVEATPPWIELDELDRPTIADHWITQWENSYHVGTLVQLIPLAYLRLDGDRGVTSNICKAPLERTIRIV